MTFLERLQANAGFQFFASYLKKIKFKSNSTSAFILLDGGLNTSHNIIFNILIGLAANKEKKLNVAHLTGVHETSVINYLMADSLGSLEINFHHYANRASVRWRYRWEKLKYLLYKKHHKLLEYKIEGVLVGDLIYDSIIRFHNDVFTIETAGPREKSFIFQAIHRFYVYKEILKEFNIEYIVLSHKYYIHFGIMPRLILRKGGKVISENRGHLKLFTDPEEFLKNDFLFDAKLLRETSDIPATQIDQFIQARFSGQIEQHDVKNAFVNKKHYSREEIVGLLNLDANLPIATILPHAFSDAPHCHQFMVYDDYYQWFIDTLRIIKGIKHVNWLIKPHPSSAMYFEDNVVSQLLEQNSRDSHIHLLPSDIHTESVFKFSDTVVTVRGTAGLESVLYNIKPIICGDAVYDDLGITKNCRTVAEYERALSSIQFKGQLSEEAIYKARLCLYWWHYVSLPPLGMGIIPKELVAVNFSEEIILNHDINAYENAAAFLKEFGHEEDIYFGKLCEFFRYDRARLSGLDFVKAAIINSE
jgi:hypothetical protein